MKKTLLAAFLSVFAACGVAGELPLPAAELQELSLELSGRPGYFDTDNLITNEASFQQVLPVAQHHGPTGGVYLGVGPAQNFTYIAHLKPELALLVDLRADNRLLMLYLRSLFIESTDRWEYLAGLLGRPPPGKRDRQATATDLVQTFEAISPDEDYFEEIFERCWQRLRADVPLLVSDADRDGLHFMVRDFFHHGFELRFRSHGRRARRDYPNLRRLLTETDGEGRQAHYLATESDYHFLRSMQLEQRIVPVVGDLGGSTALPRIAGWLQRRDLKLSAFYVSNVEFYLFSSGRFQHFVRNVERLPRDPKALLIRSYFGYGFRHPLGRAGYRVTSLCQHIDSFLKQHRSRPYHSYADLVLRDYLQ